MPTKSIIHESYKGLITISADSPDFSTIQDDVCITPQLDCDVISATMNPVTSTHISDPTIATRNIGSFDLSAHLSRFIQILLLVYPRTLSKTSLVYGLAHN